jgi:hypothetical protein
MKTRHRQSGMSICGLRMAPSYFEYISVKKVVTTTATEVGADKKSIRELRRRLENMLNTNQVYDIDPQDIEIFRKDGKIYIDANYEARIPIMGRIDAVMNFDDLKLEVGSAAP